MKYNNIKVLLILIGIVGISACSEEVKEETGIELPRVQVKVKTIKSSQVQNKLVFSGRIEASKKVNLSTRLMGIIESISVKVGDKVKKGEVIFTISKKDLLAKKAQLNAQKKQATAVLENLKKDKVRTENLFKKKSATQKQLDDINTAYLSAEANVMTINAGIAEVNSNLSYATVIAPFSGEVSAKMANVGNLSSPGIPVIALVSTQYKAVVTVSENQISDLKEGDEVTLIVPSLKSELIGKITQISPSGAFNAGQFAVSVVPNEQQENFKDGLFAQVTLSNKTRNAILLDKEDIITRGQLQGVFTVGENQEAVLNWIRLGKPVGNQWSVLSGVNIGDQVIYQSKEKLKDGQKITIK